MTPETFTLPLPQFTRHPANPILPPLPKLPHECSCCMNPYVLRKDDTYWLYYAGGDKDGHKRICLATAPVTDITQWTRHGVVLDLGQPGAFDANWTVLPHVVDFGGKWHLYYTGNCGHGKGLSSFPGIGLALSDDGVHFERYSSNPIIPASGRADDPDRYGIAGGSVIHVEDEWRFFYTGCPSIGDDIFTDQQKRACLAVSQDGIHWTKRGAVMTRIPERDYVNVAAAGPVVRLEDRLYCMLYSAIGTRWGFYSICYAESDDGITWRRGSNAEDDLVLTPTGEGWEQQMVEYPALTREGLRWRLFYCGNGYGRTGIGTALSEPPS